MKISLFSKVIQDHPLEDAMRLAAGVGYEGIELIGRSPHLTADIGVERLAMVKKLATELKLPIINIPSYVGRYGQVEEEEAQRRFEELKRFVQIADFLDCRYVRHIPSSGAPDRATDREWEAETRWVRRVADYAAQYGVNIVLEMHEGSLIETADSTKRYLDMAGARNLALTYDVGNLYMARADYSPKALKKIERYVHIVHVRDHAPWGEDGRAPGTLMGDGVIDYVPIVRHLRDIGFEGYLSAECELFAASVASKLSYAVPTTSLSSAAIIKHEYRAIRALLEEVMAG